MPAPFDLFADRERLLDELLGTYLESQAAGNAPPWQEFVAAYPDLAQELERFFKDDAYIDRLTTPLRLIVASGALLPCSDRYLIERPLGAGITGTVFFAQDLLRGTAVALKVLHQSAPDALQRFKQKFRRMSSISHPNLVALHELQTSGSLWFITMNLVDGVHFLDYVCPDGGPARDYERLRAALCQVVEGVNALHRAGILHRDLKPSNILVSANGAVSVIDFGMSTEIIRPLPEFVYGAGTAAYMAPEQCTGVMLTASADIYSIGTLLYTALTGQPPFQGASADIIAAKKHVLALSPNSVVAHMPHDLSALCDDMLQLNPDQRPTAAEILHRLGHIAIHAITERGDPPFVGRVDALAELETAFQEIRQGSGIVLLLHGPTGIGKTRLLQYYLEGLRRSGRALVLDGRCFERESIPYKAVDQLIDRLAQHLARLPVGERDELLPPDLPLLAKLFPVLESAVHYSQARTDSLDLAEVRRPAFRVLREILTRLARKQPLVMAIDDLHWGDADSASLLIELLSPPEPPPFLFLGCFRNEDRAGSPLLEQLAPVFNRFSPVIASREVAVHPLEMSEARQLAESLLREEAGEDEIAHIVAESGGVPFFINELSHHCLHHDATCRQSSLDNIIWERINRLSFEARNLLQVIAIAGRPVKQADAYRAAALAKERRDVLINLQNNQFVRTTGSGEDDAVETYHFRIRQAVTFHLTQSESKYHHRRLAEVLEERGGADPESLSVHWEGAEDYDRAAHFARFAGDRAAAVFAFDQAARHYRRALELQSDAAGFERHTRRQLADALGNAGRAAEAAPE